MAASTSLLIRKRMYDFFSASMQFLDKPGTFLHSCGRHSFCFGRKNHEESIIAGLYLAIRDSGLRAIAHVR